MLNFSIIACIPDFPSISISHLFHWLRLIAGSLNVIRVNKMTDSKSLSLYLERAR